MKHAGSLLAAAAILLMAGCANLPQPPDEGPEVTATLARYEHVATLKAEEQRAELNAALTAYERTPDDKARLNLALALLLPRTPGRDDSRVELLLGRMAAAPGTSGSLRHDLAQLLLRLVIERRQVLRDDRRKMDMLAGQLHEERRRIEELQRKIESLRAIDRDTRMQRNTP